MQLDCAIIPAAGLGTRNLPLSSAVPKELLPIINKPLIHYIVEEAIQAGLGDIYIIISLEKEKIINYFETISQKPLARNNHGSSLTLSEDACLHFLYQITPRGVPDAIIQALPMIEGKDFAVLLSDELFLSDNKSQTTLHQMLSLYDRYHKSTIAVQSVDHELTNRYGIVNLIEENDFEVVTSAIEKPKVSDNHSNIAMVGRYVFKHSVIETIEELAKTGQESNLSQVISQLCQKESILAYRTLDNRYDCSLNSDYLEATLNVAYNSNQLKQTVVNYANEIIRQ